MKNNKIILICLLILPLVVILGIILTHKTNHAPQPLANRPKLNIELNLNQPQNIKPPSVEANKLPQFIYSLKGSKFDKIIKSANNVTNFVKANITHTAYAKDEIAANITLDQKKRSLIVSPQDLVNFIPGLYKLSLTLRTTEGDVNIDQDFSWGVIAVNTNKSVYRPGEIARIGFGVLNDKGNTLCMTGLNRVDDLSVLITNPQGNKTTFSIKDKSILDSGKCGATTVTNDADFQSTYQTTTTGIYQIKVTAVVYGKTREIEDYFKVDSNITFDVERTSFPTRIYPQSPYPVTFTVISNTDYSGAIEDTMPSFFRIEHIQGAGNTQTDNSFTKVIWNTTLKAGVPKTFTYFIKFPPVSPEFYLIGPLRLRSGQAIDFEEARQWQIASDAINSSTGVFTAEDNNTANTWYRNWTGTAWSPALTNPPSSMSNTPADSRWFKEVSSPVTGEKLVGVLDNNNNGDRSLYIFRWSGSAWSLDRTNNPTTNWGNTDTRYFDIAYEQVSGEALLAYYSPDNANVITYATRTSSGWSSNSTTGTATSPKSWIKLVPQTNSNNILMTYVNTSNYVGAQIWDGSSNSFANQIVDNAGTLASGNADETVTGAWESQTKIPMIMWSNNATGITYRRYTGSWTTESTTGLTGYAANVDWLNSAADDDATSNNIAIGSMNTGGTTPNCDFAVWNGSTWTKASSIQCQSNRDRGINVAFEHGTNRMIWVYVTSAAPRALSYTTWTSGGGFVAHGALTGSTPVGNILTIELYSDFNTPMVLCLYTTASTGTQIGVYDREWDGNTDTWSSVPSTSLFGNVNTDAENAEAFGFGFDMNLENLVSYRWFNNLNNLDVGTPLTTQNTTAVLQTANASFRLRLLLYVSDQLPLNARYFTLQFVDPGTGDCDNPVGGTPSTWTNVGTGTTTLIAFNDNAGIGVTDGANLTANANDPTYPGSTVIPETYEEQNDFINSRTAVTAGQSGMWDFSLYDNTTYDVTPQTFCFRVIRNSGALIKTSIYPMIVTASLSDVVIQGGTIIQQGTTLR
jgi:hypothetical protein